MAFDDTPFERRSIISGMHVRASDGKLLGYVALIGQEHLYVRRSPFNRRWKEVPLSAVKRVLQGDVLLRDDAGPLVDADAQFHGEIPTQTFPLALIPGTSHV
ncbi:hypothetical protein G4177_18080 [Corallococcus sp. ZKHCc1 1396]|uniref:PRC-barrel domain containing protein n=1 Tax=Corallococcus soli TaxID=2710757 RepID=A0ABR9PQ68_9BACT|nr:MULTISPECIES: hypothetical protein [Corallococcus]MBE4750077.1 hypothetical protein [Corallococcus soli]MCY1034034.1 hypothetical protein [Corallococcus sp. BB11-1]